MTRTGSCTTKLIYLETYSVYYIFVRAPVLQLRVMEYYSINMGSWSYFRLSTGWVGNFSKQYLINKTSQYGEDAEDYCDFYFEFTASLSKSSVSLELLPQGDHTMTLKNAPCTSKMQDAERLTVVFKVSWEPGHHNDISMSHFMGRLERRVLWACTKNICQASAIW
jgi:hypothetical protein